MAIIRSNRQTNYTVIDNRVFADHQLSFAAMGLLGYLLSKPDNWQVSVNQLIGATEGTEKQSKRDAVLKLLDELKAKGFVQMKRKAEGGVDYIVFDSPQSQNGEIPLRGKGRITAGFTRLFAEIERWPTPKMLIRCLPPRPEPPKLEHKRQLTPEEKARGRENLKKLYQIIAEIFERKKQW